MYLRASKRPRGANVLRRTLQSGYNARGVSTSLLCISSLVRDALARGVPVVALESTIISHGLPYPENVEMARGVERLVKEGGAVPATIAILDGRVKVGIDEDDLQRLASAGPSRVRKVSTRNIGAAVARGEMGATTVAATMKMANLAGIDVFVTGGIGGVHRGGETTLDVSADLTELSRTPVTVVCAGVKSILDIEKTLEYLETQGVPVFTLSATDFPAFFSPTSGLPSPDTVSSVEELARIVAAAKGLYLSHGHILAVPNPEPTEDSEAVEEAIRAALGEADAGGIRGAAVTPFILKRVSEKTKGASLRANLALVRNNARVGAALAVALKNATATERGGAMKASSSIVGGGGGVGRSNATSLNGGNTRNFSTCTRHQHREFSTSTRVYQALSSSASSAAAVAAIASVQKRPIVIGGAVIDIIAKAAERTTVVAAAAAATTPAANISTEEGMGKKRRLASDMSSPFSLNMGSSNPGSISTSFGGVGRNMAEAMARCDAPPLLVTALGGSSSSSSSSTAARGLDARAQSLVDYCQSTQLDMRIAVIGNQHGSGSVDAPPLAACPPPTYLAVLDSRGDLVAAVADMAAFDELRPENLGHLNLLHSTAVIWPSSSSSSSSSSVGSQTVSPSSSPSTHTTLPSSLNVSLREIFTSACPLLLLDANLPSESIAHLTRMAVGMKPTAVPVMFESTSVAKCLRAVGIEGTAGSLQYITMMKQNKLEAVALAAGIRAKMGLSHLEERESSSGAGDDNDPSLDPTASSEEAMEDEDGGGGGVVGRGRGGRASSAFDEQEELEKGSSVLRQTVQMMTSTGDETSRLGGVSLTAKEEESSLSPWERLSIGIVPSTTQSKTVTLTPPPSLTSSGTSNASSPAGIHVSVSNLEEVVFQSPSSPGSGGSTEVDRTAQAGSVGDDGEEEEGLDYSILTAAQTILAAMVRSSGTEGALSPITQALIEKSRGRNSASGSASFSPPAAATTTTTAAPVDSENGAALIEGRKHVLVTLGSGGLLWLSAPPARTPEAAERLLILPFFAAARDPEIKMDFTLIPAPPAKLVKCTGAGDTLGGAVAAALVRGYRSQAAEAPGSAYPSRASSISLAQALRQGIAAAKIAVESPLSLGPSRSTISPLLSLSAVEEMLQFVAPVEEGYADDD